MSGPAGFQPSFRITHRMTTGLTRIERARGFLEAARLSEDWLAMMRSRAFVLEAHHTTHIEGTRLTLEQAERLLAGEAVAGTDPNDARELLNYRDAFEFVSGYLNDGGPVTEGLIREIHRRLVAGVRGGSAAPGAYRRVQNYVVNAATGQTVYKPPPPYDVPPLMAELVAWLNTVSDVHPVLLSGVAQFQLVHTHRAGQAGDPAGCTGPAVRTERTTIVCHWAFARERPADGTGLRNALPIGASPHPAKGLERPCWPRDHALQGCDEPVGVCAQRLLGPQAFTGL